MVTNPRTLRALVRAGWIEWKDGRERHWTGQTILRRHVRPGPKLTYWSEEFTHRGRRYRLHYLDGCFHPFVFRVGEQIPAFI